MSTEAMLASLPSDPREALDTLLFVKRIRQADPHTRPEDDALILKRERELVLKTGDRR